MEILEKYQTEIDDIFSNVTCIEFIECLNAFCLDSWSSRYLMQCIAAAGSEVRHCSLKGNPHAACNTHVKSFFYHHNVHATPDSPVNNLDLETSRPSASTSPLELPALAFDFWFLLFSKSVSTNTPAQRTHLPRMWPKPKMLDCLPRVLWAPQQ